MNASGVRERVEDGLRDGPLAPVADLRNQHGFWLAAGAVAAVLLAAMAIVNPFREFLGQDDSWAYARSVETLLRTGEYRLDQWSAANMPVQIYLAAGLAKVFGYSLSLLRLTTLGLMLAGLVAFLDLLRELGVELRLAAVLTLGMLASPLVLMLGFTFMSDIQFTSWMMIALCGYVRGLNRGHDGTILLASVAAAFAIGTRQFGIALLGGLGLAFVLPRGEKLGWGRVVPGAGPGLLVAARRVVCAVALPLAAALWQFRTGFAHPTVTQVARLREQSYMFTLPVPALVRELVWRISVILEYAGLSLLPVAPLVGVAAFARAAKLLGFPRGANPAAEKRLENWELAVLLGSAALVLLSFTRSLITTRPTANYALPLWWMLPNAFSSRAVVVRLLAMAGVAGAFPLCLLVWRFLIKSRGLTELPATWVLVMATGVCLLVLHLGYVQLNDTYVAGLLPFALLLVAYALKSMQRQAGALGGSALLALVMVGTLAVWMRGEYNLEQARWRAADKLGGAGVPAGCVDATRHWLEYHGAFDEWLAETQPDGDYAHGDRSPMLPGHFQDPFYAWLVERAAQAPLRVAWGTEKERPEGWQVVGATAYRDERWRRRTIETWRRADGGGSEECRSAAAAVSEKQ